MTFYHWKCDSLTPFGVPLDDLFLLHFGINCGEHVFNEYVSKEHNRHFLGGEGGIHIVQEITKSDKLD